MERLTEKHYLAEDHYMKCPVPVPSPQLRHLCRNGDLDRLEELAEADKDGRVVILPCKVGDKLYRVFAGEILEHKVGNMRYLAIQGRWDIDTTPFCPYVESSIGKTIFLTCEEAGRALMER